MNDMINYVEISGRRQWGGWFVIRTLRPNYKFEPAISGFWFWKRTYRKCINLEKANAEVLALAEKIAALYVGMDQTRDRACDSVRIDYWCDYLDSGTRKVWYKDINRE